MTHTGAVLVAAALLAGLPGRTAAQDFSPRSGRYTRNHSGLLRSAPMPLTSAAAAAGLPMLRLSAAVPTRTLWSASDLTLASAFTVALLIDASQTRGLARRGWRDFRETNPILGPEPSVGRINTYTAISAAAVLGAAVVLPRRVRPWLLGAALAVEAFTIGGTVRQGVAISFP